MEYHVIEELELEIARLRKELTERIHMCDMRSEKILELTAERDEARKMYCGFAEYNERGSESSSKEDIARALGWDCYKEDGK